MAKEKARVEDILDELIETAKQIVEYKCAAATGFGGAEEVPEKFKGVATGIQEDQDKIIAMVKPFLRESQQTKKINAKSVSDIISLLSSGKVSIKEAVGLLAIVKQKTEIEEKEASSLIKKSLLDKLDEDIDFEDLENE